MEEKNKNAGHILPKLISLEERIAAIERKIGIHERTVLPEETEQPILQEQAGKGVIEGDKETALETNIGSFGLAIIGNTVLLFGIIFLWQYLQQLDFRVLSFLFGYLSVAIIVLFGRFLRERISHMSFMFNMVGQFLLYFFTLRLHFFSDNPVISWKGLDIFLLLCVIGNLVYISEKKKSQFYLAIALAMTIVTGYVSETIYFMLSAATITSVSAVYFFYRYGWRITLILSIFMSYAMFITWMLKNPGLLNADNIRLHHVCNLYLISCAMAFSMITLVPQKEFFSKNFIMGTVLLNGITFSFVLMFFVFTFFINNYVILFVTISVFCIIFSIILKNYSAWKFSPAFYAMYGFVAISVSFYGLVGLPYVFLLLALQSLLVLSMSLWFRSQIIIGLNTAMLFILLITYLMSSESVDVINFSFATVAFITARVINIKKQLINLETNYLRNLYLSVMFVMVLYSLHQSLPDKYITFSWAIAAIVFFIFSMILDNVKYRLMTILAIIAAAFRLFLVDLSRIQFGYRMAAFLFLAAISISISLYYYSQRKEKNIPEDAESAV